MNKQEYEFGRLIARRLDQGLVDLDPGTLARLQTARARAVAGMRLEPAPQSSGASGEDWLSRLARYLSLRYLIPVATVLVLISGMVYWQHSQSIDDLVDIDAKLLAGDLPIDAYLDSGLDSWLKR